MQFVTLTLRDTQLPVIVNLANVDYIQSAGGNGSNLHFSRETIYVVESPAEIEARANNIITIDNITELKPVVELSPEDIEAARVSLGEAGQAGEIQLVSSTDATSAKPGSKRETK